jgi:hypothetical protein
LQNGRLVVGGDELTETQPDSKDTMWPIPAKYWGKKIWELGRLSEAADGRPAI